MHQTSWMAELGLTCSRCMASEPTTSTRLRNNGFEQVNLKNLSGSFAPTEIYLRDGADIPSFDRQPGEYVYQAIVHLGADADTTVSAAANMENATYFLSSGSADITTSDGYGGNTTLRFLDR